MRLRWFAVGAVLAGALGVASLDASPLVCWDVSATATAYVATAEFRATSLANSWERELEARATEVAECRSGQGLPVEPGGGP